jgi:hypothetical protein
VGAPAAAAGSERGLEAIESLALLRAACPAWGCLHFREGCLRFKEGEAAIVANPQDYGLDSLSEHLFGRSWYNTAVIFNIVDKLTAWSRDLTNSDRWIFLSPDIIDGLTSGLLFPWARSKLLSSILDDTQYICFICNTGTH